ncbi:MAG: hypothetical protein JWO58_1984 [Chitinophagaceae bacterium]|nr:hypothetical protein [Chitinophagaceae bacterium]
MASQAQFVSATLGINGLTCSMCSYAVQAELERLPFVQKATLDLNTNIANITFNDSVKVDMRKLVDAVYKAGFSVGYTEADYVFHQLPVSDQSVFSYQEETYEFLKPSTTVLNGRTTIKFIDKKFIAKKGHAFWAPLIKESLNGKTEASIYHITL